MEAVKRTAGTRTLKVLSGLALVSSCLAIALPGGTASAAVDFHYGFLAKNGGFATSQWYQNIRAVMGWSDIGSHKAWVHVQNSTGAYGSEVSAFDFVCHSYAKTSQLRFGVLRNLHSVNQDPMRGRIHLENPC
jgi:hypothetical protein